MEILIITGPPYSGKGTQCEVLKSELGFEHISTGDRIRVEKAKQTEFGKIMSEFEEKGNLVPDSIMKQLLQKIIDENKNRKGIILDGYPRTASQVDTLLDFLNEINQDIYKVINIDVPKNELILRAQKRAETSNRIDDKDASIHFKRIEVFEYSTRPAIEYMKTKFEVVTIDGLGSITDITEKIKAEII